LPNFNKSWGISVATLSTILAAYSLLIMREFLRPWPNGDLPSRRALAAVFGAQAAIQMFRAVIALASNVDWFTSAEPRPLWFGAPTMIGFVFLSVTSILLIAVAKEEAEQRSTRVLALARMPPTRRMPPNRTSLRG